MLTASIWHRYAIIALFKPVIHNGKRDEVCRECGMYCGDEKCINRWWGKLEEGYLLEDVGDNIKIIL